MDPSKAPPKVQPRIIIHGGAGNIQRRTTDPDQYQQHRHSLLSIITSTDAYMRTCINNTTTNNNNKYPSALEIATYAVVKLENDPLFNAGHGAVFTRDGINELEASVMVSRGFAKRGVGVTGLRSVKNPILLAKAMLEHGDEDLLGNPAPKNKVDDDEDLDIPSAQGHTLLHGRSAEVLAKKYGLEIVDPSYFFTQKRWDEHIQGLEREKQGRGMMATWSADEYVPQGTCGAVAIDEHGVVCAATSTGGLTNKLTGRIGDTPVVGAGFWAEEWSYPGFSAGGPRTATDPWRRVTQYLNMPGPVVELSSTLRGFLADCLPTPFLYKPDDVEVRTSMAVSGTGNGDSFFRVAAARSVASIARWSKVSCAEALNRVAGRGGELQQSAGPRWGKTGEGEGGMIGIEYVSLVTKSGVVLYSDAEVLHDHNCTGMFRAWIRRDGRPEIKIWHDDESPFSTAQTRA
ncbi:L-asparaginase precursor [Xylaria sp. CBS 124048]|nr:L-asparaginase precursor [Xylaria sp. CBS 124048]